MWRNPAFCFRFSILTTLVWLMASSVISLITYFIQISGNGGTFGNLIFDFSTWLFILPSVLFFGLINALPLIIPWLMKPVEEDSDKTEEMENAFQHSAHYNSYQNMAVKLELEKD